MVLIRQSQYAVHNKKPRSERGFNINKKNSKTLPQDLSGSRSESVGSEIHSSLKQMQSPIFITSAMKNDAT